MSQETVPPLLYHGSLYKQNELMPGFKRSGKLVQWDGVENNTYLYTTSVAEEAMSLGLGSALEKTFNSRRYTTFDNFVVVYFNDTFPSLEQVYDLEVYRYTIRTQPSHQWVKNNNPFNNIDTEWITQNTIRSIESCVRMDIEQWLAHKEFVMTRRAIDTCPRQIASGRDWIDPRRLHRP